MNFQQELKKRNLTASDTATITKLVDTLQKIDTKQKVFFNLGVYRRLGLITLINDEIYLTEKAKQLINF